MNNNSIKSNKYIFIKQEHFLNSIIFYLELPNL